MAKVRLERQYGGTTVDEVPVNVSNQYSRTFHRMNGPDLYLAVILGQQQ
jgi:hypothetical protein